MPAFVDHENVKKILKSTVPEAERLMLTLAF